MTDNLHTIFSGSGCPAHGQLRAYHEGRLEESEKHSIEVHLADCEMCSDELEGLSLLSDPDRLPEIVDELEQRMEAEKIRPFRLNTRMILAAAAVIILLVGAMFVFRYVIQGQQETLLTDQQTAPDTEIVLEIPMPPKEETATPPSETKKLIRKTGPDRDKRQSEKTTDVKDIPVVSSPALTPEEKTSEIKEPGSVTVKEVDESQNRAGSEADEIAVIGGITIDSGAQKKQYTDGVMSPLMASKRGNNMTAKEPNLMVDALDLCAEKKFSDAAKLFQQVVTKDPENYKAIYHLAICYFETEKEKKALKTLEKILENPDNEYYQQALDLKEKW